MTTLQYERALALAALTFDETFETNFVRSMASNAKHRRDMNLSEKQGRKLAQMAWKHRKRIDSRLVPAQDPSTIGVSPTESEHGRL